MYAYTYIYVYMQCVYIYIYMYTERERERERERDTYIHTSASTLKYTRIIYLCVSPRASPTHDGTCNVMQTSRRQPQSGHDAIKRVHITGGVFSFVYKPGITKMLDMRDKGDTLGSLPKKQGLHPG